VKTDEVVMPFVADPGSLSDLDKEIVMRTGSILITDSNGLAQEMSLGRDHIRIGSAPDNDIVVAGAEIALHHATVTWDERGRLVVEIGAENLVGQGGMRLTFNLGQVSQRRDLAWIGDYVLSYEPAGWESRTQPLDVADLPAGVALAPEAAPAARSSADETALLAALLGQRPIGPAETPHDAPTLAMPLLALAAYKV
jgi:FHA domain-containing protein